MEGDIFLHPNMILNYVLGVRPTNFQNPIWNYLHRIYSLHWLLSGILLTLSLFYEMSSLTSSDGQVIVENLRITLLITFSMVKYARIKSNLCEKLVEHIRTYERNILETGDPHIIEVFQKKKILNKYLCKYYLVAGYFTLSCFLVVPLLYEQVYPIDIKFDIIDNITVYRTRPLPFGGNFPFDKFKYYKAVYFFHIWTGWFCCAVTIIPDIFYWSLMIYGTTETTILCYKLANFKRLALGNDQKVIGEDEMVIVNEFLRECIFEHKSIIKYVENLDECIKYLMLVDSCLTSVQIAVIGFGILVIGINITQIVGVVYLLWTISQLFFFYWFANEIRLAGNNLQDAIWESHWYECNISIKKMLLFILRRTQIPLALNVGPFYAMSVDAMLSILKTAISYFALMRQMYTN